MGGRAVPNCVCGSSLRRISLHERGELFQAQFSVWQNSDVFRSLLLEHGHISVVCDLCEDSILSDGQEFVWVCENGDNTIKHATSQDICDRCFVDFAWGNQLRILETQLLGD